MSTDGVVTLLLILEGAVLIAVSVLAWMLKGYGAEKGRNLATKEDIASITHEIEAVRSQYLEELERLRSDLARGLNMHKARYENELHTYQRIWEKLVPLEQATLYLRPTKVFGAVPSGPIDEHNRQLLKTFAEAFNPFAELVYQTRPFYPESVYLELTALMQLTHGEAQAFRLYDPSRTPDYWDKALENADAIVGQIDKICDTIRSRLSETSEALTISRGEGSLSGADH